MVVAFSPVTASKHIKEKYYRYLKTTFKMGEPYKKEYEALLENQDAFAKDPTLMLRMLSKKASVLQS